MKVFKFGGASVKDADSVRNVKDIIKRFGDEKLVVVISAMGKTTNALEKVVNAQFQENPELALSYLEEVKDFHNTIIRALFPKGNQELDDLINNIFVSIEWELEDASYGAYDFVYDQVVSAGELLSTQIISSYLNSEGIYNLRLDARDFIRTDNTYREANVDWKTSQKLIRQAVDWNRSNLFITQGFIGGTSENFTTTLGREGSDYSAAILSYVLQPEEMIVWKDVPGFLNADPKFFENTQVLRHISYKEAIELAYYGASVIHPKTIKPLQNKHIPLKVKSFLNPDEEGTLIDDVSANDSLIPSFIVKDNQRLISVSPKDFSFIVEQHIREIFEIFEKERIKVNMMQNSALNFSVVVNESEKNDYLIELLRDNYQVLYNKDVTLITIRHYTSETVRNLLDGRKVLLEQKTRNTARFVVV
ncbi:MAG: aspartate kinase [Bacteroidetes bacterium]|nr:MAG: aspartate kinase [Bacteroidota bacterium]